MNVHEAATQVIERLTLPADAGVTLVCLDGMAGSGKSTLARSVADACPGQVRVVHADDFYGRERRDWRSWSPRQGYQKNFDHVLLEQKLLRPLKRGETARFQRYDWSSSKLADWVEVLPEGVVLVEGVYLLRADLRPFWDLSIYVDTPREIRLSRAYARGENDSGWIDTWAAAEDYYQAVEDPAQAADLIVRGW